MMGLFTNMEGKEGADKGHQREEKHKKDGQMVHPSQDKVLAHIGQGPVTPQLHPKRQKNGGEGRHKEKPSPEAASKKGEDERQEKKSRGRVKKTV